MTLHSGFLVVFDADQNYQVAHIALSSSARYMAPASCYRRLVHGTGVLFWSLHILPKGYTKSRRFGGFSNYHRQRYIAECRDLLTAAGLAAVAAVAAPLPQAAEHGGDGDEPTDIDRRAPCCPTCKVRMRCIGGERRRSWKIVMRSHYRPHWYSDG